MKRKFVLIAALVAALAVVFIGCPYPTNGGGESTSGGTNTTPSPGPAEPTPTPTPPPAVRSVEVTCTASWTGIDLLDSKFTFTEGDRIEATGKIIAVGGASPEFAFNDKPGGWGVPVFQATSIAANTALNVDKTLTSAMVANIAAASPKAIRIQGNNVDANTLIFSFQQIKITRGSTVLLDLAAHLATLTVGETNTGLILPGSLGFQNAGTITTKVIEE